ncbi:MAG: hypothetical protein WCO77_01460 [bacterium]
MKVLVNGSNHFDDSGSGRPKFEQACRDIGVALAKAGHDLIIGSSNPTTADRYIVEGVASVEGKHTVSVLRPDEGLSPFSENPVPHQERIQFRFMRCRGTWTVGRIHQILAADVVIIIGGGRGTAQVGYSAPLLGVPVLALPVFGGAAREVWDYLERDYDRVPGVKERSAQFREAWRPEHANAVMAGVKALVDAKLYKTRRAWQGVAELLLSVGLLVSWIWLFSRLPFPGMGSFFVLLLLSALLGTVLRRTLRSLSKSSQAQQGPAFSPDAVCSLLVAFGLMLIAFMGDLTMTGKLDLLNPQSADLQRVSIVFSVIGFFAGFLMEKAARLLAAKLGSSMSGEGE